ncbi:hypothetical protein IW148_005188 [Coemansia sp. RSA 1199]|nr:hypothetical protein IW148_005188 [Coemansia sp. RSA 1199]
MRARNYALQAQPQRQTRPQPQTQTRPQTQAQLQPQPQAQSQTQRGLRRNRSNEVSPVRPEFNSMRRVPQRIAGSGRQHSEPVAGGVGLQPPTRRLRTTPSANDLRTPATPLARQRRPAPVGGSLGRSVRVVSPAATRPAPRRPLPSPHVTDSRITTHIPHPAPPTDDTVSGISHTFMFREYQERGRQLSLERQTNVQLIADIKSMSACIQSLELDLADTRAHAADEQVRADEAERERERVVAVNRALEDKLAALMDVVKAQAGKTARSTSSCSEPDDGQSSSEKYARMVSRIGAIRGACNADNSHTSIESKRSIEKLSANPENMRTADKMLASAESKRRQASHEARIDRRRSTMLFAGLIRPSGDSVSMDDAIPSSCQRCDQLLDSLQTVQIDNDYYREANAKLRDNVSDVVSRHNAMVRAFECERARRRDRRAHELAEASHLAARDRARLNAHQRIELGMSDADDLALRFDHAVHIS